MTEKLILVLLAVIIGTVGVFVIALLDGAYDALGVFLMMWANNIGR